MKIKKNEQPVIHTGIKELSLATLLLVLSGSLLFAGGKSDEYPPEPVDGNSHWTHTVNLDELEEGKHNLVIMATDEAGNVRIEGPYDFKVDPETDIPIVAVAHPQPGTRVGRMLPIIGTARDDDGIARVEVSINDGPWRPASGAEAWSAVLDAAALGDGAQVMAVKSIDLNGLESPIVTVPFLVDTSAPVVGVTEPVSGALIAGKTEFSGTFEDLNGIAMLDISRDGGENWEPLRFSKDKASGSAMFKVSLDSRDLEDGPVVWWFRGTDEQGTVSEVPFLFFVDNRGPEISLELPVPGEDAEEIADPVPGNIFLAGTATDQSGVTSLRILTGKNEPIDIPVTPGNPWWAWHLDLSGLKDKQVDLVLLAADGAGNTSEMKLRIPLDIEADKPLLTIDDFENLAGTTFPAGEAYLTGVFSDEDGIGAINWSAGELSGRLEPVERTWRLDLPELPFGPADLELIPEDRFGLSGDPMELSFLVAPGLPVISLDNLKDNAAESAVDWAPGSIITSSGGSISGSVVSDAGKELTLTWIASGGEEVVLPLKADADDSSRLIFQIPVRKGEEPGSRNFILRATDGYGGESVLGSGYYVQAAPDESGNIPDPRNGDDAVNLPLPFLREKDGAAILRPGQPLQGWSSGASTSGAKLEPESPLLRLRTAGTSFSIGTLAPGLSEPVRVVLSDGSASRSVVILTDHEAPRWELDAPTPGAWSSGTMNIAGTVVDNGGISSVSWSLKGGRSTDIAFEEMGEGRFVFNFESEFTGQADGPKILVLKAGDAAGNVSEYEMPFVLDTQAPVLSMTIPPPDRPVGALSTLVYEVSGDEILDSVSITVDGESRMVADEASLYALALNLAGYSDLPETLSIRAVDRAGNIAEQVPSLSYDPVSDKPETYIQTPVADSVVRGPSDIAGLIADDDAIAAVYWRIDGGDWKKLPGDASFRVPLPLDSLVDGSHLVEVYAEDTAGNVGEADAAWFDISRREAEVSLITPEVGHTQRGISEITGTGVDANGISEVWISFDNGHSFFLAEGATDFQPASDVPAIETGEALPADADAEPPVAELPAAEAEPVAPVIRDKTVEWRYAMDTRVLDNGVHTLLIKVVDGAGDEALLAGILEIDNSRPILAVGDPAEGSLQTGSMVLEGRVKDAGGLAGFHAVIERDGVVLLENNELADGVFHIPFDFSGLEAGEVLLRVEAVDTAGNSTAVSRSFVVEPGRRSVTGEIILPVEGGREGPYFSLTGFVNNVLESDRAVLVIDEGKEETLTLDKRGRFAREFVPGDLSEGDHVFRVDVMSADGERSEGTVRSFNYRPVGSWVLIDGYPPGMAVGRRPLLTGRSGYYLEEPPEDEKDAYKDYQKTTKENRPGQVEVSLDGGLTFEKARGSEEWEYRIETGEMGEGDLPILIRAQFPEGPSYARTLLRLDKTLPDLKANESVADGRFNGKLEVTGTASDDRELEDVSVTVRPGSHTRYEVPSFIQGMYFDVSALGATWANGGLGVTFFDDNVKLQVTVGWAPELIWDKDAGEFVPARVSGTALGATLLANVVYLPLGYMWGPKWDNLSFSLAIGANFTYFTNFGEEGGGVMSAVVAQMEIPKIVFPDRNFITYLAPYIEGKLWFFSSDVSTTPYLTGSVGLRLGLL